MVTLARTVATISRAIARSVVLVQLFFESLLQIGEEASRLARIGGDYSVHDDLVAVRYSRHFPKTLIGLRKERKPTEFV
jgi:hypothetical protein